MIIDWTPAPYTFDEADRFADPDLDSLEPIVEAWLTRDTDPEGMLHGIGLAVRPMGAGLWADPIALTDEPETWACDWLIEVGRDEDDGSMIVRECGAPSRYVGAGWACEAGHRHEGIEAELAPWGLEWEREQAERAEAA